MEAAAISPSSLGTGVGGTQFSYRLLGRDPVQLKVAGEGPTVFCWAVRSLFLVIFYSPRKSSCCCPFFGPRGYLSNRRVELKFSVGRWFRESMGGPSTETSKSFGKPREKACDTERFKPQQWPAVWQFYPFFYQVQFIYPPYCQKGL